MTDEQDDVEGIACRKCGCRHLYVLSTRRIGDNVVRLRFCRNCSQRLRTVEAYQRDVTTTEKELEANARCAAKNKGRKGLEE